MGSGGRETGTRPCREPTTRQVRRGPGGRDGRPEPRRAAGSRAPGACRPRGTPARAGRDTHDTVCSRRPRRASRDGPQVPALHENWAHGGRSGTATRPPRAGRPPRRGPRSGRGPRPISEQPATGLPCTRNSLAPGAAQETRAPPLAARDRSSGPRWPVCAAATRPSRRRTTQRPGRRSAHRQRHRRRTLTAPGGAPPPSPPRPPAGRPRGRRTRHTGHPAPGTDGAPGR
jgi:hypothetical protein